MDQALGGEELSSFISELHLQPERENIASELEVLQSIYGESAISLWKNKSQDDHFIRYEVVLSLPSPHDDATVRILVSLPPSYPTSSPPRLQLLSKYIGDFGVDADLFGAILRTYISVTGVEWAADTVCVFDGLQNVVDRCTAWFEDRLNAKKVLAIRREDGKEQESLVVIPTERLETHPEAQDSISISPMPYGIQIFTAEPIVDRKSSFVGRACRISHPSEVPLILANLLTDRRIARAAHPVINAWRCEVGDLLHQDNDDDGETAAGGRIAHLLQILEVDNVLVVVTRYFGGIHLGPDRFKHINQAARNALDAGGFLDDAAKKGKASGRKRH